ncbi:sestrin-1 isoform X2 [Pseudomyrmex gracilis]|uniref:sestrin-1 isoform X2 n=1 Tax=Pseudomyrmex gracilis TaxID=219809 RepID=UPI00099563BF|nr:sestrin-1 isoform X2 [Pseudomyrmex gracilis]
MYREPNNSSGSGASTKGDEVELVSRFLAPLCARDEAARNIALAAARNTVEGWLGGVGSPSHWEDNADVEDIKTGKLSSQDGRYDMSVERSPTRSSPRNVNQHQLIQDTFRTEGFFPQSVNDNSSALFLDENNSECSFDCVDGRLLNERRFRERYVSSDGVESCRSGHSTSSDEGSKRTTEGRCPRFGSSCDSERKYHPGSSSSDRSTSDEYCAGRTKNNYVKVKGAKQKQLEDDEIDADTRVYGKSPKFDDNLSGLASYDCRNLNRRAKIAGGDLLTHEQRRYYDGAADDDVSFNESEAARSDGVVFNTLDGFENENETSPYGQDMNLESRESTAVYEDASEDGRRTQQDYLRKNDERKFSAGQIKRPLSQDEDVSAKSGRVLESPEVTPGDVGRMLNLGNALDGPRQAQANKYLSLVTLHLPVILRLSVNCPFQNVRIKCAEILQMVKDRGLPVPVPAFDGPSAFVPLSELPDLNNLDEKTHMLLMDAFLQNNRLDHVSRVMASHPKYLEHFLRTQQFILRGDGPLPYDYRHLIAIMAAGRHQCSYLINLQKGEFLYQGGDPLWLQGLRSIPGKLQDLYEINKILAHRPWLLNKSHIEKLTKGDDNWSLAEVVHAIVLLAHFHSLSSFVFSCGINEELDNVTGHHYKENIQDNSSNVPPAKDKLSTSPKKIPNGEGKTENVPSPPPSPSIVGEQEVGVETLMERMKRLSEKSESNQITQEELSKRFETVETQSAELAAAPQRSSSVLDSDIGLFIEDPTFIYQDFAKDYSWDVHGYSLANRLYNDVGNLLDEKFKTAYNLTYYTMGTHNKVDTSRFRRAIWNYIQCMFGIRHDDYDYNEVNQLLERSLKTFIKSAVCYPERVTKKDYDRVMREFKHSEKVHVNLMILEARMQAELLYALRAVMRYMT